MSPAKKKGYAIMMALGGVVLLVDRLVPGGAPPDVPASVIAQMVRPGLTTASAVTTAGHSAAIPTLAFPRGLPHANLQGEIRDFFAPPYVAPASEKPDSLPTPENPTDLSRGRFTEAYRLQGVLWSDGLRIAVMNNRWQREGDVLRGCTILAISDREVRIACHDGETALTVGTPSLRMPH